MSTFRKDLKLGTMVPMIRGDDIANGSVEWEHLSQELQSIIVKTREEDIRLADIDLSASEVRDVIRGTRASRLRVISSVRGTVCVMGILEMYSCSDGSGIVQKLQTDFKLDEKNNLIPIKQGRQNTYFRRYNIRHRVWSVWVCGETESISNDRIDIIIKNVYK